MNLPKTESAATAPGKAPACRRRRQPARPGMTRFSGASDSKEARRTAAAILEVLAGVATPTEAAQTLGVSLPRYYALEGRALEGLVKGCAPRPKGPRRTPQRQIAQLKAQIERLEREAARNQALLRAAQRAVGLAGLERRGTKTKREAQGHKRKRRRPRARALRAAKLLRQWQAEKTVEQRAEGEHNDAVEAK